MGDSSEISVLCILGSTLRFSTLLDFGIGYEISAFLVTTLFCRSYTAFLRGSSTGLSISQDSRSGFLRLSTGFFGDLPTKRTGDGCGSVWCCIAKLLLTLVLLLSAQAYASFSRKLSSRVLFCSKYRLK